MPIGRIEGYGNPATGELWIRAVPLQPDGEPREDGVQGSAQALSRPDGYRELIVDETDPIRGSSPNDTIEFYTVDPNGMRTPETDDDSTFDPGDCLAHLSPAQSADPFYDALFTSVGAGCALQTLQNFYDRRFEHVFFDIDQWTGNYAAHGPYGPGFTTGTTTTRPGRNGPSEQLGLWDFGSVEPRGTAGNADRVSMWIFFKNGEASDFNFRGTLVGEVVETCGNLGDEDLDGVVDNNCGNALIAQQCFSDEDCDDGLACRGASIISRFGAANGGTDTPGSCVRAPFGGGQLATATGHSCAVTPMGSANEGEIKCWGSAASLGTGSTTNQPSAASAPELALGPDRALSVAAGAAHSCAVFEGGDVRCWGGNGSQQARGASGTTVIATSTVPLALDVGAPARQVVAGVGHTCVLRDDGGVRCFGANGSGECGARSAAGMLSLHGTKDVQLGGQAAQLCAGAAHTCALLDNGAVRCWGSGAAGRLGYGNTNAIGDDEDPSTLSPVSVLSASEISAGRSVRSIACGGEQTCAILDDGGLRCWGNGVALGYAMSANPNKGDDELPSLLPLVDVGAPVKQVSIGTSSACALLVSGAVKCWGSTAAPNGCLGYAPGCPSNLWTPPVAAVDLGANLSALELATRSTGGTMCALLSNGSVKCWGANNASQAGIGSSGSPISDVPMTPTSLAAPTSTLLDACTSDLDCSPTTLCHQGMCVTRSPLRFTLTWSSDADLDLHVTTPSGPTIQWNNTPAGGGALDDDEYAPSWNLPSGPHVENIAFPGAPPVGHYTFWTDNSTGPTSDYTLEAYYDGVLISRDTGTLTAFAETTHFEIQFPSLCGDDHVTIGEQCDAEQGCSDACTVLPGFTCTGGVGEHSVCACLAGTQDYDLNGVCAPLGCGDGGLDGDEACDDGATSNGDGCSESCAIEAGWDCVDEPSVCETDCGDGVVTVGLEECDDGVPAGADGCSEGCTIEFGYTCVDMPGMPSDCTTSCGDGMVAGSEECDDGEPVGGDGDGCSSGCFVESGWGCTGDIGSPSACSPFCGDMLVRGSETCDDGNQLVDVCAYGPQTCSTCDTDCIGNVSGLSPTWCGDGIRQTGNGEACDDGNQIADDGCTSCAIDTGFTCNTATPNACSAICGDTLVRGSETCDDGNQVVGTCAYGPSSCTTCDSDCIGNVAGSSPTWCGDGIRQTGNGEACDDGNTNSNDGCTACAIDGGWQCNTATPNACSAICGDNLVRGSETCDDGNQAVNTCAYGPSSCTTCDSDCIGNVAGLSPTWCGDGIRQSGNGEACDDGNAIDNDGCTSCATDGGFTCTTGVPNVCTAICGDNLTRGNETCDDGDQVVNVCTYGQTSCMTCDSDCIGNVAGLSPTWCGDGIRQTGNGETCDDGNQTAGDGCTTCAPNTGFTCNTATPNVCTAICGDTLVRGNETCDDGNQVVNTCAYGPTSCTTCDSDCIGNVAGLSPTWCGDGTVQSGPETCDDSNTASNDGCDSTCHIEPDCYPPEPASDYGSFSGTTAGHGDDYAANVSCGSGTGPDVTYSFVAPLPGKTCFDTLGSGFDTQLHIQTTCADNMSEIQCSNNGAQDTLQLNATPGSTYYTVVDGINGAQGSYSLQIAPGSCCSGTLDVNGNGTGCLGFSKVSVGTYHTCGITTDGRLYCWGGQNGVATLGDGTSNQHDLPAPILPGSAGANDNWSSVSAGVSHTCAIRLGRLYCWGTNLDGQLGDTTFSQKTVPTEVAGGATNWLSVTAGNFHTCGIKSASPYGTLWCWGRDANGQVGNGSGSTTDVNSPTQIGSGTDWQSASASSNDGTCGVRSGTGYCWGLNTDGQLGIGSALPQAAPFSLTDTDWSDIKLGHRHGCGLKTDGSVYCWGYGVNGALGTGNTGSVLVPTPIDSAPTGGVTTGWQGISVAGDDSCAWRNGGELYCWGYNIAGEVGDNSETLRSSPTPVAGGFSNWTSPSMGYWQACAIRGDRLSCWGDNNNGQLGTMEIFRRRTLTEVGGGYTNWQVGRAGPNNGCGIRDGHLYCWGYNANGEVGDGTTVGRPLPTEVLGSSATWQAVDSGGNFACGIDNGVTRCWGTNPYGGLGNGTVSSLTHITVSGGFADWTSLSVGSYHACAIRSAGGQNLLYCWGDNFYGELGVGNPLTERTVPTQVTFVGNGWTAVSANADTTCGVRQGRLYCWGYNAQSQVGDGSVGNRSTPYEVLLGGMPYTDWQSVSSGALHTCAMRAGRVYCLGSNVYGQLGINSTSPSTVLVEVFGGFADWTELALGSGYSCALRGGRPYCWGYNSTGQLGDGTTTNRLVPTLVHGLGGWSKLSAGWSSACALRGNRMYCWGTNIGGQIGIKRNATSPQPVVGPY